MTPVEPWTQFTKMSGCALEKAAANTLRVSASALEYAVNSPAQTLVKAKASAKPAITEGSVVARGRRKSRERFIFSN